MFDVIPHGNGFAWQLICQAGRPLYGPFHGFSSMLEASEAAKQYRAAFWRIADRVDHRMGRCI